MSYAKPITRYEPHRAHAEAIIRAADGMLLDEFSDTAQRIHSSWQVGRKLVMLVVAPHDKDGHGGGVWHYVQGGPGWSDLEDDVQRLKTEARS